MKKMLFIVFCLIMQGCGSNGILDSVKLTKPLTSDSKLALVIKRFQFTTCKETCLVDYLEEYEYENIDTGEKEFYYRCPLNYTEFLCIDLYKTDDSGKNVVYKLSPQEWQTEVAHLFGYYSHEQIKRGIAQVEFLCSQDFAVCENHFDVIQTLVQFHYERNQE